MKGLNIRYRKTELMFTQWKIDLILNIWFICIRLKLSYIIDPSTPIKIKVDGKIFSQIYEKQVFLLLFNFAKF